MLLPSICSIAAIVDPIVELALRFGCALAVFAGMAAWELLAPRRLLSVARLLRWPSNLAIVAVGTLLVRLLVPAGALGAAVYAAGNGMGLLHWLNLRLSVASLIGFLALDLAIYAQHVVFHHVPWLWRLHRMHHTDLDIDVSTGLRFHPFEILISLGVKIATIMALGVPPVAVFAFEVLLNATSLFSHSNVRLSPRADCVLRLVLVTPDMHRVHHSVVRAEHNSNFGFNLPWWDRLFGTYRREPAAGHDGMTIGLSTFRDRKELCLDRLLTQPFRPER